MPEAVFEKSLKRRRIPVESSRTGACLGVYPVVGALVLSVNGD
mgnify:FL=1